MSDFIPAPKGLMPDEPVDPRVLGEDYARLVALAGRTTQHQWANDAFSTENVLKQGHPVRIREAKKTANLYQATYNGTQASIDGGNDPRIRPHNDTWGAWTTDPNIYQVAYNRGLQPVSDMRVEWTTPYPELVWIIQDLQYLREKWNNFGFDSTNTPDYEGTTEYYIRFKARLSVNGGFLPGTGTEVIPFNTRYRGSGYATRAMRTNFTGMTMVPAGTHTVQLYCGQGPSDKNSTVDHIIEQEKDLPYDPEPPTEGVVLGHRSLIVVSFPLGLPLGG